MALKLLSNTNGIEKTGGNNIYPGKSITETITNGLFTVDRKWTVQYWNRAAEKLLGVQAMDIVGKNLWEKFAGTLPVSFYSVYHKAFLQDIPVHFQEYWGEVGVWFDVITWHTDDTLSVSFKCINPPGHQAKQLRILNEHYRFVTQVTNDCLWEWNLQAKEFYWIDGGHKRVFGYPIENSLIPQSFWESLLHREDKAGVLLRVYKKINEGGTEWEDEYRFKKADGDYAHVHDRGHIVYERGKASRMIGATQDITKRVLLENKLTQERVAKQRELTSAVLTAQEHERADIGKELHDNLNQILAVAKLYLQMAQGNSKKRDLYLEKTSGLIVNVIEEIRRISKHLVIPGTHIISLFDNIKNLLNDVTRINPIKIEFHKDGVDEKGMDEKLQRNIFRIVQEQVNNILKHSKATHAAINFSKGENEITLLISDNGEGCDILNEKKGVGIINITSRAELYRGNVTVISEPGKGYQLKVILPLSGLYE
jgi:PAS domain S-box-containing protein